MKRISITLLLAGFLLLSGNIFANHHDENPSFDNVQAEGDSVETPKYWKFSGMAGLNVNQVGLWNWAGGGNNNANGRVYANLTLLYKKDKLAWETNLDTDFGLMYSKDSKYRWKKPNDKIVFTSKLGYEFAKTWYLTIMGGFKSQYAPGYEYTIENNMEVETYVSKWLSPSYTEISVGIDWKPNDIFTIYYSPVAGRIITCTDSILRPRYAVPEDKTHIASLGMTFKAGVNYSPVKNLRLISTLTLYTPYTSQTQPFGNIDVDWDFMISYQFLKVLNVSLATSLKYYDGVMITDKHGKTGPRVQFREVFGVGIGYSF